MTDNPSPLQDPRVYFAAERTLLAWLRTGIGIMAFGFVVARFGLFLKVISAQGGPVHSSTFSPWIGATLVLLGAVATIIGSLRYRDFCKTLKIGEMPSPSAPVMPIVLSLSVAIVGILLIIQVLA
ncbi:YidH family protein [Planctomicrobium piriforme]|uniref:Putative membrane protein n=1 Tax=Planctomicrobium piriforme TaxID=1576369 RepID=A0A1I3CXI1_9PLAN|nr:DUF202 domain-containing protein [Planctomicrobium piriforme]SFH79192.1 putative membrane protein [Planctomicrobium piriforme]